MVNIPRVFYSDRSVSTPDRQPDTRRNRGTGVIEQAKQAPENPPFLRSVEEQAVIDIIHTREDAQRCFGGYLFHRLDEYGNPIISFAVEKMPPEACEAARKHYVSFTPLNTQQFPKFCDTVQHLGRYTVFNFYNPTGARTLRRCIADQHPKMYPEAMMRRLVILLKRYHNALTKAHRCVQPLNCLSLDTVLMDPEGRLYILPLLPHRGRYPIEIPQEVSILGINDDVRSDLYSAAMVSSEFYSGGTQFEVELVRPKSPVLLRCLQPVHTWRPNIAEVWNALNAPHSPNLQEPQQDPNGRIPQENPDPAPPKAQGNLRRIVNGAIRKVMDIPLAFASPENELPIDETPDLPVNDIPEKEDPAEAPTDSDTDTESFMDEV